MQIYASQLDAILKSEKKIKVLQHDMKHHKNELKLMANKHGIGLTSVKKIVEMYNGTIDVIPQNDIFCVKLILFWKMKYSVNAGMMVFRSCPHKFIQKHILIMTWSGTEHFFVIK